MVRPLPPIQTSCQNEIGTFRQLSITVMTVMNGKCHPFNRWVFPKIGVPQNGWFIGGNPIKMDDLGVPLFLETTRFFKGPIYCKKKSFKGPTQEPLWPTNSFT